MVVFRLKTTTNVAVPRCSQKDLCLLVRCKRQASLKAFLGTRADLIRNIHGVTALAELDGDEVGDLVGRVAEIKGIQ